MSRNCIKCAAKHRTGPDLLCDLCRRKQDAAENRLPLKPGYYWAKWRIPSEDTPPEVYATPSDDWEIVQVNMNTVDWVNDPTEDEALSVSVPGVRETQWRDCFVWGDFVSPLKPREGKAVSNA